MDKQKKDSRTAEAFHIRYRNTFVTLFLIVPAVVLPVILVFTLAKSNLYVKWYHLHVVYDGAASIAEGNDVTIHGIRVGDVRRVSLDHGGNVNIQMRVRQDYAHLVKKNSKALFKQKSMVVGDWQVELVKGSDTARTVVDGDTLQPQFPLQLDEVLVQAVATITDIQKIVQGVSQGKGTVGRLFAEDSVITLANRIGNDVHRLVGKISGTVGGLDAVLNTYNRLGTNGGGLVDSLVGATNRLNTILAGFAPLAQQMQPLPGQIDKVLQGVQKDLGDAEVILKAVQKHGLIRKQVHEVEKEDSLGKGKEQHIDQQ